MGRWQSPSSPLQKKKTQQTAVVSTTSTGTLVSTTGNADATDLQRSIQCPNQAENNGFQPLTSGNDRRNAPIGHQKETEQRRCHSADNKFFPSKACKRVFSPSQRKF
jgi:hypothetical protein